MIRNLPSIVRDDSGASIIEMGLMLKAIKKGPEPDDEPEAELISETLVPAAE